MDDQQPQINLERLDKIVEKTLSAGSLKEPETYSGVFEFQTNLDKVLDDIRTLMLSKNRKYGNSALEPKRIFSKANAVEQIKVRLDDKLSRLMSGQQDEDEDVELDLIGYLLLLRMARVGVEHTETPEQDDIWIEWKGGRCPVAFDTVVRAKCRDGMILNDDNACSFRWTHFDKDQDKDLDIIAYQVVKENQK